MDTNELAQKIKEAVETKLKEMEEIESYISKAIISIYNRVIDNMNLKRILWGYQIEKKNRIKLLMYLDDGVELVNIELPLEKKDIAETIYYRYKDVIKNTFVTNDAKVEEEDKPDIKYIQIKYKKLYFI